MHPGHLSLGPDVDWALTQPGPHLRRPQKGSANTLKVDNTSVKGNAELDGDLVTTCDASSKDKCVYMA